MKNSSRPLIMVCANLAWNLYNFRAGLIAALIAKGYRVLALAPSDPPIEEKLRSLGCDFAPVPFDAMGLSPWRDLASYLAIRKLIRQHRPQAWLSWTIKPNVYGSFAAAAEGVPAFPNVSGLGTAFIRRNLLTSLVQVLYRTGFRRAQAVFFQNADDQSLFLERGLVRAGQARLLPGSGIDVAHFEPAPPPSGPPQRLLLIARLLGDKGVREYAEAARLLRKEFPEARFGLLGASDAANRTAIPFGEVESWCKEGLIEYHPPVEDVRPMIAESDWVVLPSYREGLSRVLIEAGAMARPAIATDVPGCRDIVRHGETGFLAAPRDARSLAEAMRMALELPRADWKAKADAARKRVEQDFSQDRVTALYCEALRSAGVEPQVQQ